MYAVWLTHGMGASGPSSTRMTVPSVMSPGVRPRKYPPPFSFFALHDPVVLQLQQDRAEELLRDALALGDLRDQDRTAARFAREHQQRFQTVFRLLGQHAE
jgi:hypothetical protein